MEAFTEELDLEVEDVVVTLAVGEEIFVQLDDFVEVEEVEIFVLEVLVVGFVADELDVVLEDFDEVDEVLVDVTTKYYEFASFRRQKPASRQNGVRYMA